MPEFVKARENSKSIGRNGKMPESDGKFKIQEQFAGMDLFKKNNAFGIFLLLTGVPKKRDGLKCLDFFLLPQLVYLDLEIASIF